MIRVCSILLATFCLFQSFSQADEPSWDTALRAAKYPCVKNKSCDEDLARQWAPVTEKEIRLVGRSLLNKKSGQYIALSCTNYQQTCESYRFIVMIAPGESYYVGPMFRVSNEKVLQRLVKDITKQAKNNGDTLWMFGSFGGFVGVSIIGGLTQSWLPIILGAGIVSVLDAANLLHPTIIVNEGAQTINQDGWNWSIKPKAIKNKVFNNFLRVLTSDAFYSSTDNHYQYKKNDEAAFELLSR